MLTKILEWIRSMVDKMLNTTSLNKALGVNVSLSPLMTTALQKWSLMYVNQAEWLNKDVISLQLPAAIAGEIARMVTIEMGVDVTGSPRAEWLHEQMEYVTPKLRQMVEYGNAKGGLMMKPYVRDGKIAVDFVQADCFYPITFDANGCITACVFSDSRKIGMYWYTRLEFHQFSGNACVIRNSAFKSSTENTLGNAVPLAEVADWAELTPEATITNIEAPLYGYFRYPLANNIDPQSPLGVSCYARAVDLIKNADELYSNLVWEFESGKRALYVDELAFGKGTDGKPLLPIKRLYRTLQTSGQVGKGEEFFKEWSPEFREAQIKSGLNAIKREIEFTCGLAFGTISDPQVEAKTATEVKTSQQRTYSTITDAQKALENALEQLLYAMDVYATLYNLVPRGTYTAAYEWDDSIVKDADAQFTTDSAMVDKGAMSLVELRMKTYGETKEEAEKKIKMARVERADRVLDRVSQVRLPNQGGVNMPNDQMSKAMNNNA
jgi:A118 family predicted phage portal protein